MARQLGVAGAEQLVGRRRGMGGEQAPQAVFAVAPPFAPGVG